MIAKIERAFSDPRKWAIRLVHGHQSFSLSYEGTKKEATWYAKMFQVALAKHDKEVRDGEDEEETIG